MNTRSLAAFLSILLVATGPVFGALTDGLMLYYSFDTNTGSTVRDQSGNGHNGTVYGAAFAPSGAIGAAYRFDGIDDRILGGSLGYVPTGSICFWMYSDVLGPTRHPFSTDYASWDDNIHFMASSQGEFQWSALGLDPGGTTSFYMLSGLQTGRWYHVTLTWDGLVTRGYFDGTLACSTPYPAANATYPNLPNTMGYWRQLTLTFNNIAVGNSYSTSPGRYWKGMVDELRIYNRALTAAEILALSGRTAPVEPSKYFVTTIGFSDDLEGDQDVTEFVQGETLYIRLRDVDIDSAERSSNPRVFLTQKVKRGTIRETVLFTPQSDGSFLGSCSLARFQKGAVEIAVYMNGTHGEKLSRISRINIH
jgi:hypothetical protein